MRRYTLNLTVALLAFGLGVSATTLWLAFRTPEAQTLKAPSAKVPVTPVAVPCGGGPSVVMTGDGLFAPPPPPAIPKPTMPISGGVLNGKAISKPVPAYPAIAKAARASGTVTVQIIVDETGRVLSARAVSGHPLLQAGAVHAAYQARFTPMMLSEQPVKVSGVITYNFVLE